MDQPLPPPNEVLARIAEATLATVGLEFVQAAGRLISAAWGIGALFVSEIDHDDPESGRVLLTHTRELRPAEPPRWIAATGSPWFPPAAQVRSFGAALSVDDDPLLQRLGAKSFLVIQLESRSTSRSEFIGMIASDTWDAQRAEAAESLLRLISGRAAAEMERERLAQAATAQARALRYFGETLKDGVLVFSGSGNLTVEYMNKAVHDLLGKSAAELRANPGDMLARLMSLPRSGGTREAEYRGDIEVSRPHGVQMVVHARVLRVEPPDGLTTYYCFLSPAGELERELLAEDGGHVSPLRVDGGNTGLVVSRHGEVTLVSGHAAELLGATDRADLAAVRVVVRGGDKGDVSMTFGECLRQLGRHRYAERVLRVHPKRGGERFLDLRSEKLTTAGSPGLIVNIADSTSRESRIAELEERTEIFGSLLGNLPLGVLAVDRGGTIIWISEPGFEGERALDEMAWAGRLRLGDNLIDVCQQEARAGNAKARDISFGVMSVLRGSVPSYAQELASPEEPANQPPRSLLAFATPLSSRGGAVLGLVETTGLTEQVRAAELDAARAWALLASLPEQVARLAPNGDLVQVIGPAQRAPGVALLPSGAFRRNVREVLPAEEAAQLLDAAQEAMQRNQPVIAAIRVINGDAERRYEARLLPMENDLLLTLLDRTAEEHARTQREPDSVSPRLRRRNPYDLTFREASVLELMAEGASDKEIAQRLGVSVFTVNKHVSKVLHKMGATSRTEASMRAVRESLVNR